MAPKMTFEEALDKYIDVCVLEERVSARMKKYNRFRGPMGLVPDEIRNSPAYQRDKRLYDQAFKTSQDVAKQFLRVYKKEYMQWRAKGGRITVEIKNRMSKS